LLSMAQDLMSADLTSHLVKARLLGEVWWVLFFKS
jgi:hypothetical protein